MNNLGRLLVISLPLLCAMSASGAEPPPLRRVPATAPDQAVKTLRLQHGFRAELVAAEPLVTDPVAMQYDENGLAYVVEMNDYPYSDKSHDRAWQEQTSEPLGRVRVLEDTDGDGRFDKSTVFADKLSWPSGLALWKGGVYVAATPDVLYLKDTDGDRRADVRRQVFTGFRKYNVQAVINNFQWGLDHRIYAAGSSNGGDVRGAGQDGPVTLRRSDFRFDPRSERLELVSGGARFGNTLDDWGNRFLCNIRNPVQHVVMPARYLRRNPRLPVATALQDVASSGDAIAVYPVSPPEPWRVINAARQALDAAAKPPHDSTVASGFVTSSSGVTIYRGAAYGPEFQGNAFVGEVAGNLVLRYRLSPAGVSFQGRRPHEKVEFLASTDNWFRPVNFVNAPDGTLHVLDMCRETIEHPWSMPDDLKARVDLTSGRDRGRIYRLLPPAYPPGFQPPPQPRLGEAAIDELAAQLESPNAWWRETASRLIFERQDARAVTPLRQLLRGSSSPLARLHALWGLEGLGQLTDADLRAALADDDAHVREHAVRLAEPRLQARAELLDAVLQLADDEAPRVRFQTALSLGELDSRRARQALAKIARRDSSDSWMRLAVLSSLSESGLAFLQDVLADDDFVASQGGAAIVQQLCIAAGSAGGDDVRRVLAAVAQQPPGPRRDRLAEQVVDGLGAGLKRGGQDLSEYSGDADAGTRLVAAHLAAARETAQDPQSSVDARLRAVDLLGYGDFDSARTCLPPLLDARQPRQVQLAAVRALTSFPQPEVAQIVLAGYQSLTPDVRDEAVSRLLTRTDWLVSVLDAIAAGKVSSSRISWVRRDIYMKHSSPAIRQRAIKLFQSEMPGARKEVVAQYQSALSLAADARRGQELLKRECLQCHRQGSQGHDVGPNLASIRHRTKDELLLHILDPNREVQPNYLEYVIQTDQGRMYTGIIAAETATSITLRQAEGKQETILRSSIERIRSSDKSLMPEGLEKKLTPQDLADVLAVLLQPAE